MPNRILATATTQLPAAALDPVQVIDGTPATGVLDLADSGFACGLWEHSVGTSTDVEADEVFVVLSGRARIDIEGQESIDIGPGDVVQLEAGTRTTWQIHEDLRKFWVTRP